MSLTPGGLIAQALVPASPGGPRWWQWGLSLSIALAELTPLFGSSMRFYRAGVLANPAGVERPRALVCDGAYRLTRNPMYAAMAAILAAHAVLRGPRVWLPVACFALLVGLLQVPAEKVALWRAFPKEYEEYAKSVSRWVGRPRWTNMAKGVGWPGACLTMSTWAAARAPKLAVPQASRSSCSWRTTDQRPVKGKNHSMPQIVIVGGHGKVTLLLAPILAAREDDVVALTCDPAQSADVAAAGAVPKVLSVEDASTEDLADAFMDADAIMWTVGMGGKGGPGHTDAIDRAATIRSMDTASRIGVRRYVMALWVGSHGGGPLPANHPLWDYALMKLVADRHLAETDLEWTIAGPGTLTLEEPSGKTDVRRQNGQGDSLYTSYGNIAAVTAAVLVELASIGRVVPLGDGPAPIAQAVENVPVEFSGLS